MSLLCDRHCVTRREVLLFIIPADNSYPERFGVKPCKRKGKSIGMYNSIITKIYISSSSVFLVSLLFFTGAKHLQAWQADQMGACTRQEWSQNWLALALTLHLDWASFGSVQPASKEVPRRFAPGLDTLSLSPAALTKDGYEIHTGTKRRTCACADARYLAVELHQLDRN